jgi:hypothetical protein
VWQLPAAVECRPQYVRSVNDKAHIQLHTVARCAHSRAAWLKCMWSVGCKCIWIVILEGDGVLFTPCMCTKTASGQVHTSVERLQMHADGVFTASTHSCQA